MSRRHDYLAVARLHMRCLDRGFLATLGERFLALMYEAIDLSDDAVLLTETVDGQVVGFITGGSGMGPIYRRMLRSPLRLAVSLAPAVVQPAKVWRIVEILRYSGGQALPPGLPDPELLSFAVAPNWRGKGIAERLYRRLLAEFLSRGIGAFRITVGEALSPAHAFYRRMGAVAAGQVEVHGGERSTVYVHRI